MSSGKIESASLVWKFLDGNHVRRQEVIDRLHRGLVKCVSIKRLPDGSGYDVVVEGYPEYIARLFNTYEECINR